MGISFSINSNFHSLLGARPLAHPLIQCGQDPRLMFDRKKARISCFRYQPFLVDEDHDEDANTGATGAVIRDEKGKWRQAIVQGFGMCSMHVQQKLSLITRSKQRNKNWAGKKNTTLTFLKPKWIGLTSACHSNRKANGLLWKVYNQILRTVPVLKKDSWTPCSLVWAFYYIRKFSSLTK